MLCCLCMAKVSSAPHIATSYMKIIMVIIYNVRNTQSAGHPVFMPSSMLEVIANIALPHFSSFRNRVIKFRNRVKIFLYQGIDTLDLQASLFEFLLHLVFFYKKLAIRNLAQDLRKIKKPVGQKSWKFKKLATNHENLLKNMKICEKLRNLQARNHENLRNLQARIFISFL